MSDLSLATTDNRKPATTKAGRTLKITRIVRRAIELMVWHGLKRDQAAQQAGMKDNSLYVALRRPDVKAYYLAECEVLRLSGRARRISRLEAITEQDENKQAAVNAIRALELMGDDDGTVAARSSTPGFVIQVINVAAPLTAHERQIEAKPLIEQGARQLSEHNSDD